MHGRKQRFATIFLALAFIATAAYCYIWMSNVRQSAKSISDPLAITTVDWNQLQTLSFGEKGRQFHASLLRYLTALRGEPNDQSKNAANWTPTFVTAASDNHFFELRGMVHSMQSKYPDARFLVYDLGLADEQRNEVRRWCNTRYVPFAFDRYPPHVKNLHNYAWKPLIIAEQLSKLGTFFWVDASPRLKCNDLSIFPRAVQNGSVEPFLTFGQTLHSMFAATHPGMLQYFPTDDVELLKVTEMKLATVFVSDSSYTRVVLNWILLCALTKDCIAPEGSQLACKFKDRYKDYGHCHRYDQSLFALTRLHLLYLRGYSTILKYHSADLNDWKGKEAHISAEQLRTLSTEWERRYEPFESCIVIARGDDYNGTIPSCTV